jgi:hypothetical protein
MVIRLHGASKNLSNVDLGRHLATEDVAKKDIDIDHSTTDIAGQHIDAAHRTSAKCRALSHLGGPDTLAHRLLPP